MSYTFHSSISLGQTDAGGRIFFARIFDVAHLAFEGLLERVGYSIPRILNEGQFVLPVIEAKAEYKAPLVTGDKVAITPRLLHIGNSSFSVEYSIKNAANVLAAKVTTIHVCVGKESGTKMELPADLRSALEEYRGLVLV